MDNETRSRRALWEALQQIASRSDGQAEEQTETLRRAFLLATSESEDNTSCIEQIDYGSLPLRNGMTGDPSTGLRLQRTGWGLADILWSAEGSPIPEQVRSDFPDLRQDEWDAVLRFATCLISCFEGREQESEK